MALPRLLKRLSRKNLRSDESPPPLVGEAKPPPLPPKSAGSSSFPANPPQHLIYNQPSHGTPDYPWAAPRPYMSDTDLPLQQVPAVVKYSNQRPATGNGPPLPPSVKKANPPDATLAAKIAVAASVTAVVVEAVGGVEAIEEGVNTFMEGSQVLMNALGEVAKLHPFISVAVMTFQAVWALEVKRREKTRRLGSIQDVDKVAPDGTTIKGRLEALINRTSDDIRACANACDTYSKKKLVVKVLKGPIWEGRLVKFCGLFTQRRGEFEFALSIHTALGVDAANKTLGDVDKTTREMNEKMELMMRMFQQFTSPEQKDIMKVVESKGGLKACQENDKILKELNDMETAGNPSSGAGLGGGKSSSSLADLKEDLHLDPGAATEKNMAVFVRKFEVQKRQIIDELSRVVQREGDRVISAVTAGPHDKIVDPDIHELWKMMGWRGSVKTRHFVMALRDYYQEKLAHTGEPADKVKATEDAWALSHINVVRLQPISEAFDDDSSGFVTVGEVNIFAASRPLDWSLCHWIAFWSIGWHQSIVIYKTKIRELIAKMFAIMPSVLPSNRAYANDYLDLVYRGVTSLESAIAPCFITESLQEKFRSYVEAEENRLRDNLRDVRFDIDARDTLELVVGPGRIERFVMPLLFLLLQRDFEIFRIAQTRVLHPDELWDASETIKYVIEAVDERVNTLKSTFQQQKLDLTQQFKLFGHGIFDYMNEPLGLWQPSVVQQMEFPDYPFDDNEEAKNIDVDQILNYPVNKEHLDFHAYDIPSSTSTVSFPASASPHLRALLGQWNGFNYSAASVLHAFHADAAGAHSHWHEYTVDGSCWVDVATDTVHFTFTRAFPPRYGAQHYAGTWDACTDALTGTWGPTSDEKAHEGVFVFKRIAQADMCFFPSPRALQANRARALWGFAGRGGTAARLPAAVELGLYVRNTRFGRPLAPGEVAELGRIEKTLTSADSRFYHSLAEHKIQITTGHAETCDVCDGPIGGARISCLHCQMKDTFNTIDFCAEDPTCMLQPVGGDDLERPHVPASHDLFKVRRVVHVRQFGKTYRDAKEALRKARSFFEDKDPEDEDEQLPSPPPSLLCAECKALVAQPCWYCVHCDDPSFICDACDAKDAVSFGTHDMQTHDLVRVQELVDDMPLTMEERFSELDARFVKHEAAMDGRLRRVEERLGRLETAVDTRMSRVEKLLERILASVEE
ncbi:hypothetical protein B0H14DRAFT_3866764 [Mycena olivaceomarginata]|nr:hypothetical protein B0H14DRAFT_3866764 [Mycena olivaceomarginata]